MNTNFLELLVPLAIRVVFRMFSGNQSQSTRAEGSVSISHAFDIQFPSHRHLFSMHYPVYSQVPGIDVQIFSVDLNASGI